MTNGAPSREWLDGQSVPPERPSWGAVRAIATRLEPVPEARWSGTTEELRAAYYDGSEP